MRQTVLVIEDDADVGTVLADALQLEKYLVERATTLSEAFAILAANPCDLVLTDSLSPLWDDRALSHVRQIVKAAGVAPVVMVTGHSAAAEPSQRPEGLAGLILKPFDVNELLDIVRRLTSRPSRVR